MARTRTVSDRIDIAGVTPEVVYAQVSDPTQMARWSPENRGAEPSSGSGTKVGDEFVGANSRGGSGWHTRCRVTAADPGSRYAFDVVGWGVKAPRLRIAVAGWEYRFEPIEGGTRVTETWTDHRRWPDWLAGVVDPRLTGGKPFADFQRGNIARTLRALAADLTG